MERTYPTGYGMCVVIGLTEPAVTLIAADCATTAESLNATTINAPRHITFSGANTAIGRA
ncbi:hypothetical protein ACIQPT_31740 [Streptomyces sp. NPDC091289]|uniref:hypothetical protein n=1 Tax=Streptomyces sp. NPDC091289 TaxID=3365989 RepID=UPI0037F49C8D